MARMHVGGCRWLAGGLIGSVAFLGAVQSRQSTGSGASARVRDARPGVEVVAKWPHDPAASTQGLLWFDSTVFESIGSYGESELRRWSLETGELLRRTILPTRYFGEGLARLGDRLVQLTWRENVAFVYDARTLAETGRFPYDGEGWGLCFDGGELVMSDGSATLTFRDPDDFSIRRRVRVVHGGRELDGLNELECVHDRVYLNVIRRDEIARVDPTTGHVEVLFDASELRRQLPVDARSSAGVLNGIAYRPETDSYLLTGKRWPTVFEVRLPK